MASYLPNFLEVFPDTQFVYIHRDPYQVLRSFCTLIDIVDGPFLQDRAYLLDCEINDQRNMQRMGQLFENLEAFETAHPDRVTNVQYADLLATPESEMSRLFAQTRHKEDENLATHIEQFLQQQKAGSRARPRTKMIDYGYTRERVENYPPIARYLQRYRVTVEEKRQTGV